MVNSVKATFNTRRRARHWLIWHRRLLPMSDYQVYTLQWLVDPGQQMALEKHCEHHNLQLTKQHELFAVCPCSLVVSTVIKAATPEHAIDQSWERFYALKKQGFRVLRQRVAVWIHDYETPPHLFTRHDLYEYTEFRVTVAFVNYEWFRAVKDASPGIGWSLQMGCHRDTAKDQTLLFVATLRCASWLSDDVAELWDHKSRLLELVRSHNNGQGPEQCHHEICILDC